MDGKSGRIDVNFMHILSVLSYFCFVCLHREILDRAAGCVFFPAHACRVLQW